MMSHPCSPKQPISQETLSLQVQEFLDDWEFRIMSSSLGRKWKREMAIRSALELLAVNGVPLGKEDVNFLCRADESVLVDLLTEKIPLVMYDGFEMLAQQLKIMLTTTCRVRTALDNKDEVEKVMEENAETDTMVQRILKEAVVNASQEARFLHMRAASHKASTEKRLDRLTQAAETAEWATAQLRAVEDQLNTFKNDSAAKSKNALLSMADGNDKALLASNFSAWLGVTIAGKADRELREKYAKQLEEAEKELFAYKEKQLKGVKEMLMSKIRETERGLVDLCISSWYDVVKGIKKDGDTKAEVDKMKEQMKDFKGAAKDRQMKVMGRMMEENDQAAVLLAWTEWVAFHEDYKKDKEGNEAAKKLEQKLQESMKSKKEDAKKVLDRMGGATDSGLLMQCLRVWATAIQEAKRAARLQDKMAENDTRLKAMMENSKGTAFGVQARTNTQMNENLTLQVFCAWQLQYKVTHVEKYYEGKMRGKRSQLQKVQTLFKSFAQQLEEGLTNVDGDSSGRTQTRRSKSMHKGEGTVSLPDIQAHRNAPMAA